MAIPANSQNPDPTASVIMAAPTSNTLKQSSQNSSYTKKIVGILSVFILFVIGIVGWGSAFHKDTRVIIRPGDSFLMMTARLQKAGLSWPSLFWITGRFYKLKHPLKSGEYIFSPNASIADILRDMGEGRVLVRKITIPEGLTVSEIVQRIENNPVLQGSIRHVYPEGSLLPETYTYTYGENRQDVLDRMKASMDRFLRERIAPALKKKGRTLRLDEVVILASIVEKETARPQERSLVAQVFLNRLNQNMPLQSDPTTIYALTQGQSKLKRALTRKDLQIDSPYNTYAYRGLPPGPIACPGKASLEAVVDPTPSDALFFVADGSGGHAFSADLDTHNRNVQNWRQLKNAPKSP